MLRKLIKHELRATGRVMLPLYGVVLLAAVGGNVSTRALMTADFWFWNLLGVLLTAAFALAVAGACVVAFALMAQRFYKNLLGTEGYVMMTLPVSIHQQVWSKILVSVLWFFLTGVTVTASLFVMAYEKGLLWQFFRGLWDLLRQLNGYYAINGAALLAELALLAFFAAAVFCLQVYASLAMGHSASNHKLLWSVVLFFVIQFVWQLVSGMGVQGLSLVDWATLVEPVFSSPAAMGHALLWGMILLSVAQGAVFYLLTTFFLKNRLNLE